jgi:hypothetical protein
VWSSSNGGSKVNWATGTRRIGLAPAAAGVMVRRENLAGLSSTSEARTNLGLGSIATVNSPVPIANGGTAGTTASGARTNLGLGSAATRNVGVTTNQIPDVEDADARYGRFASGDKILCFQASAPTGWTQDTSQNDKVLRVVSGSGGGSAGSWTISGLDVIGNTDGTALTVAQMPAHNHLYRSAVSAGTDYPELTKGGTTASSSGAVAAEGDGFAHAHGLAAAGVSSDGSWRPAYIDVIVATKN